MKGVTVAKGKNRGTADGDAVLYSGISAAREISKKDWKAAGVEDGQTVRWDAENGYKVPLSDLDFLSDEDFDTYIKSDSDFSIVRGDSELPKSHPHLNRFNQPEAYTEGIGGGSAHVTAAIGGGTETSGRATTVGGSTSGATTTGGGTGGTTTVGGSTGGANTR
jgi:hypothetical protein